MKKRGKRLMCGIILFIAIMFVFIVPVKAEDNTDDWKTIRVSCGINNALYINKDGEVVGYCAEYLKQLAKINHWNIEYVEASWNDSVTNLYNGKIDLLFPTQMTEERKNTMAFSTSIGGYQPIGLFAREDSDLCYDEYEAFNGARIAVSKGTSNEMVLQAYAADNGFTYTPVYLNTAKEKVQALNDGTVDLTVFSTLNDIEDGKVVAMLDYLPFYYATRKDDTELLKQLNYGMNQLLIRNPELVQQVFYDFMNRNISFAYTRQEKDALDKKGTVVIGVYKDTAPLFDVDNNGNCTGIYVDLIQRLQELSGIKVKIRPLDRREYAYDLLAEGDIDFIMGSSDQAQQFMDEKDCVLSEGIMDYYTVQITQPDFSKKQTDSIVYALTNGRKYWTTSIKNEYPNVSFLYCDNSKECLIAVQSGKADATLLNSWEYNYQSKNPRFQQMMEWENSRSLTETVFISTTAEDPLLQSVMDKSIEQISNAEKEAIITGNLNKPYSSYEREDKIYAMRQTLVIFGCIVTILFVGVSIYVVMRRRAIKQLEMTNHKLQDANDAKTRFLSRMSHELRTPLNAITGYANVTKQNIDAQEWNEDVLRENQNAILRAAKYQLAIVSDLLDIQKIESGKLELVKTEVDSAGYMADIVEMIQPEANEKKIKFSYERKSTVNDTYFLDGIRFKQVLLNILHNAIKFTPEGGKVKMTAEVISQDEKTNTLKFVITDTGIGMSEDFQNQYLFHRFAQEYQGNTSPYEGCGIGLALSKDIIHLMGGEITCISKKGEGSTFTVILTAEHLDKKRKRSRKQNVSYDLSGIRVLLCEDNLMNQDMEKRILTRMRCEVDVADDGAIGLEKFEKSSNCYYNMIFMDIRMPNMDGLEATKRIRALKREDAKTIPILAVSANTFEEDVKQSLDAGMNEHLAKPVDVKMLYQKIKEYCKKEQNV